MITYPKVLDEMTTLDRVIAGESIGRVGDGELKLMRGFDCVSQEANTKLQDELCQLFAAKHTQALMAIPTLVKGSPKYDNWLKIAHKLTPFLCDSREYGSAFISRPDSAPWTNTEIFFDKVQSLWKNQRVIFIGNNVRSLKKEFLLETGALHVTWIPCPYRDAYKSINRIEREAMEIPTQRVIMCAGPTATCLAERLAKQGKHAIDLGHIGMFWRRYEENANWKEQREINAQTGDVEKNP